MQHNETPDTPSLAKICSDPESEGSDTRNEVSAPGAEAAAGEASGGPPRNPTQQPLQRAGLSSGHLARTREAAGRPRDVSRSGAQQPQQQRPTAQPREARPSQDSQAPDAAAGAQQDLPQGAELAGAVASPDAISLQIPVPAASPPWCLPSTLPKSLPRPPESLSSAQIQQLLSAQLQHQLMASLAGVPDLQPNLPIIGPKSHLQAHASTHIPPSVPPAASQAADEDPDLNEQVPLSEIQHQALQAGVQEAQRHLQSILQKHWMHHTQPRPPGGLPFAAATSLTQPHRRVAASSPSLAQNLENSLGQAALRPTSAIPPLPSAAARSSVSMSHPRLDSDARSLSALALLGAHAGRTQQSQQLAASEPYLGLSGPLAHGSALASPIVQRAVLPSHTQVLAGLHHRMDSSLQSLQTHIRGAFGTQHVQTCSPVTVEMTLSVKSHTSTSVDSLLPLKLPGLTASLPVHQSLSSPLDVAHHHRGSTEALPADDSILNALHSLPSALYTAGLSLAEPMDARDRAQSSAVQRLPLQGASASMAAAAAANARLPLQQGSTPMDAMSGALQIPGVGSSSLLNPIPGPSTCAAQGVDDVIPLLHNLQQRLNAVQHRLQHEQATAVGRMQRLAHSIVDPNAPEPSASPQLPNLQVALSRSPTASQEMLQAPALGSGTAEAPAELVTAHSAAMPVTAQASTAQQVPVAQPKILHPAGIAGTLSVAQQQQYARVGMRAAADALDSMHDEMFRGTRSQAQGTTPAHLPEAPHAGATSAAPVADTGNRPASPTDEARQRRDTHPATGDVGSGSEAIARGSSYPPVTLPTGASDNAPADSGSTISLPGIGDQHGPGKDAAATSAPPGVVSGPSFPTQSAPIPQQAAQVAARPPAAAGASVAQEPKRKVKFAADASLHADASEARQGKQARVELGSASTSRPPRQDGAVQPPDLDPERQKTDAAGDDPTADAQQQQFKQ